MVWRVEVRYKRAALSEMKQEGVFHGIDDAYDLEERLSGLWSYAVGHMGGGEDGLPNGWLRYVIPTPNERPIPGKIPPAWSKVTPLAVRFQLPRLLSHWTSLKIST